MPHKRYDISVEDLRQLISYNPETGRLTWLSRPLQFCKSERDQKRWNSRCAGKFISTPDAFGYLRFKLFNILYKEHRVCWALYYGEWPPQNMHIDHINNNPSDNRIQNLRLATPSENSMNQGKPRSGTSSFKGVYWNSNAGKWASKIMCEGDYTYLGFFSTEEDAHLAYCQAGRELHGEFFHE